MAVCSATTLICPTRLAVRVAGAGSGRAWRGDEERAAEREEQEQRRDHSLCENLRAGRHRFPPLCVGHTDRGCGWLRPMRLKASHGRMPLPFMAGSPWVGRDHRPGAGWASRGKEAGPRWSRSRARMLAAPFESLVPAAAAAMEVVAPHLRAVAVEVDPNLVPRAASRAPALLREGPGRETRERGRSRSRGNTRSRA